MWSKSKSHENEDTKEDRVEVKIIGKNRANLKKGVQTAAHTYTGVPPPPPPLNHSLHPRGWS